VPRQQRRGVSPTNITFRGIESEALLILLDQEGICGSSGSACLADFDKPSHVVKAMKPESAAARQMIQFSSDAKTTIVDIKATLAAVTRATASVRCLIDADLRRSTKPLLGRHSHEAIDVPDIGLRPAKDPVIASRAASPSSKPVAFDCALVEIRVVIYLDHNATTPLAPEVLEAMKPYFTEQGAIHPARTSSGRSSRR
jgi:cysteine sulfinate desulfinase/cysteine desulfurase-like protein